MRRTIQLALFSGIAACALLPAQTWAAAAGQVTYAYGQAQALNAAGQARPLARGAELQSGDTVQTQQGRAQVTFADGGFVALQPNTTFKIADYNYAGKEDGSEHSFMELLKGGMRFVTGAIGHKNKQNYKIKTVVATIGIRGSGGLAILCVAGSCPGKKDGLYLTGNQDILTLSNDKDSKDVHPGESFYVGCANCDIEPAEEVPVAHVDIPALKDFLAGEQCAGNNCDAGLIQSGFARIVGAVGNGDGIVTALNGTAGGIPTSVLLLNNSFAGNSNIQAVAFNGEVADSFSFADGAFMFRWTNGTLTKFGTGGTIIGTETLGPNSGDSFIVGTGPRDPLPGTLTAFYGFLQGTKSTQDSGALLGQGIQWGQVTVNFGNPSEVGVDFTVLHGQYYFVSGGGIPLNMSNGTFSSFKGGTVTASTFCECYPQPPPVPTDIVGSLEGHGVPSMGNAPQAVGLTYRIHDNFGGGAMVPGPQNWIKGAGVFGLSCVGRNCLD